MQIVSFRTLQKLKFIRQIHDLIVGMSFKKHFEGIPKCFDSITTFNLSVDCVQDQSAKSNEGQILILNLALGGCEAIDITSSSVPGSNCVASKVVCQLLDPEYRYDAVMIIHPIAAIYGECGCLDMFIAHDEEKRGVKQIE